MPAAKRSATRSAPTKNKRELFFDQDRETKGTYRYKESVEDGQQAVMGTIWLKKAVAEQLGCIDSCKVTVEADTE